MKKRKFNPLKTVTLRKTKVNGVKCWLKELQKKVVNQVRNKDGRYVDKVVGVETICYFVGANDGSNRRVIDKEKAEKMYELLIEFEKRQQTLKRHEE